MKQIMTIFGFTFRDAIKKKVFIISTIIILALILILSVLPTLINHFSKEEGTEPSASEKHEKTGKSSVCYYIDEDDIIKNAIEVLSDNYKHIRFEKGTALKIDEYAEFIRHDGKISSILVNKDSNGLVFVTITNKDFMSGIPTAAVIEVLSDKYIANMLEAQGIDKEIIEFTQMRLNYSENYIGNMDFSKYMLGLILTMLIFFAVYFYGYGVSMSVATEKTSRVMETLIVSAKPSRVLIGKCLGMGVVGLFQFTLILVFSGICYKIFIPSGFTLFGMPVYLSAFNTKSVVFILIYFILGYTLYAMMNAVSGAYVSKIEDLNSAMMPVMLIALLSFYISYFSIMESGNSIIHKIAMYVPFCSPFIMPFKLLDNNLTALELFISIAALIIAIAIVTAVSIKIYSASVLNYGKKLKLKDLYNTKV